jgi:hypothetical protein
LSFERPGPGALRRGSPAGPTFTGSGPQPGPLARRADARVYLENCIAVSGVFFELFGEIKRTRAHGGCLGTRSR